MSVPLCYRAAESNCAAIENHCYQHHTKATGGAAPRYLYSGVHGLTQQFPQANSGPGGVDENNGALGLLKGSHLLHAKQPTEPMPNRLTDRQTDRWTDERKKEREMKSICISSSCNYSNVVMLIC